jgi:hypothetical protein
VPQQDTSGDTMHVAERREAKQQQKRGWAASAAGRQRDRGRDAARKQGKLGLGDWGDDDDDDDEALPGAAGAAGERPPARSAAEREAAGRRAAEARDERLEALAEAVAEVARRNRLAGIAAGAAESEAAARAAAKTARKRELRRARKEAAPAPAPPAVAAEPPPDLPVTGAGAEATAVGGGGAGERLGAALEGQALHLGVLLAATLAALALGPDAGAEPELAANYTRCIAATWVHQLGVTLAWRAELHWPGGVTALCRGRRGAAQRLSGLLDTTTFGVALRAFAAVALADGGSWFEPGPAALLVAAHLGFVAVCALGATLWQLGPSAVSGADHFVAPGGPPPTLCRDGVFALCRHPLFFLGLLLPWAAAVAKGSATALALAGFVHAAALGFLYGTEVPDMRRLYGVDWHCQQRPKAA